MSTEKKSTVQVNCKFSSFPVLKLVQPELTTLHANFLSNTEFKGKFTRLYHDI